MQLAPASPSSLLKFSVVAPLRECLRCSGIPFTAEVAESAEGTYQGEVAVFAIEDGSILDGFLPSPKRKLVEAWIEIHKDELIADWQLAVNGETVFKIRGLE